MHQQTAGASPQRRLTTSDPTSLSVELSLARKDDGHKSTGHQSGWRGVLSTCTSLELDNISCRSLESAPNSKILSCGRRMRQRRIGFGMQQECSADRTNSIDGRIASCTVVLLAIGCRVCEQDGVTGRSGTPMLPRETVRCPKRRCTKAVHCQHPHISRPNSGLTGLPSTVLKFKRADAACSCMREPEWPSRSTNGGRNTSLNSLASLSPTNFDPANSKHQRIASLF